MLEAEIMLCLQVLDTYGHRHVLHKESLVKWIVLIFLVKSNVP